MRNSGHLFRIILVLVVIIAMLVCSFTSCTDESSDSDVNSDDQAMELVQERTEEADSTDDDAPPYSADENGVPSSEYMEYLYDEQMKEDAMNAIAEEAQREMEEELYESDQQGFPY